jgi:hypothetical protein
MNVFIERWKVETRALIRSLNAKFGPLPAKAFPGRAAILIKLLNLNTSEIAGVYEKVGSMKIGHYVPGTRIPIYSDMELQRLDLSTPIINLAWHISEEIRDYLVGVGYRGKIYNIIKS